MFRNLLRKRESGFTIIEVLIVLAIAGLILVVVLIAVPQLQRNQRNEARRSVLNRIATELSNFSGNNGGSFPTEGSATDGSSFLGGFKTRYIDSAPAGTFNTPRNVAFTYSVYTAQTSVPEDEIMFNLGGQCNGELPTGTGASTTRNYAIAVGLEGGASYCVDNQ
ncbi:prepilin-type N-terminal cleavage/methylation domain-containing protein [Candidatus Saccharibacteria bacterium]|nr:prepilin-type N-terminal cleavage/methylation domain-containing protein [Candidatus Saccharibacteria bacterium]